MVNEGNSRKIAVLDDEPDIVELVVVNLSKANFKVQGYLNVEDFYNGIDKNLPELVLLDLMLPGADGFEILKHLKSTPKYASIAVIMLTVRGDEIDKVVGLELGADDYITKPFSPKELTARVKAVLRRNKLPINENLRTLNDITIDLQRYEVIRNGKKIDLTPTEFKILTLLSDRRGWVYSREQILNHLWGQEKFVIERTVDVHIRHLREKLGESGKMIKNIRGVGYKLE